MICKFKKLVPEAVVPTKAHESDAGFDLVAVSAMFQDGCWVCGTGLALEIPDGYVGLVFPRSSIAGRNMLLSNGVGVIDSGYRGEVMFKFRPAGDFSKPMYMVGERVGQLIIVPYPEVEFVEADGLDESDRGTGGYGSSGA